MAQTNITPNSAWVSTTPNEFVMVFARYELRDNLRHIACWHDGGALIKVDSISDERQSASLKSGRQGMRYNCRVTIESVQNGEYLFHDEADWFMEPIVHQAER